MAENLLYPVVLFSNKSMVSQITSSVLPIFRQDNLGIQLTWSGSPTGLFDVQVSSNRVQDLNGNVLHPGTFVSVPLDPMIQAAGVSDDAYIELNQMTPQFIQVVYTPTSGTGTLNGILVAKAV